jgi:hypothetical protein
VSSGSCIPANEKIPRQLHVFNQYRKYAKADNRAIIAKAWQSKKALERLLIQ